MPETTTQPILAGNWKMNADQSFVAHFLKEIATCDVPKGSTLLFLPFPYLFQAQAQLSRASIDYGAQNVFHTPNGAYTGEVSTSMLEDLGCSAVLIGHSERRQYLNESNTVVAQKVKAALQSKLTPIVCIGESLADRQANKTVDTLKKQLDAIFSIEADWANQSLLLAYEPIWAIGTGETASCAEIKAVHGWIKAQLTIINETLAKKTKILYGGSVKPGNALDLLNTPNVGGLLVGGASLDVKQFKQLVEQCKRFY
jgi:triosephosphate isomerase (TIM)